MSSRDKTNEYLVFYTIAVPLYLACYFIGRGAFNNDGIVVFLAEFLIFFLFIDPIRGFIFKTTIFIGTLHLEYTGGNKKEWYERLSVVVLFSALATYWLYLLLVDARLW